ncbi:MAG: Exopolysaccharide biosynthesis polyprenyl glycosylphosphotransferase, partial [uncultured Solirubrobacteraceae bacterium]
GFRLRQRARPRAAAAPAPRRLRFRARRLAQPLAGPAPAPARRRRHRHGGGRGHRRRGGRHRARSRRHLRRPARRRLGRPGLDHRRLRRRRPAGLGHRRPHHAAGGHRRAQRRLAALRAPARARLRIRRRRRLLHHRRGHPDGHHRAHDRARDRPPAPGAAAVRPHRRLRGDRRPARGQAAQPDAVRARSRGLHRRRPAPARTREHPPPRPPRRPSRGAARRGDRPRHLRLLPRRPRRAAALDPLQPRCQRGGRHRAAPVRVPRRGPGPAQRRRPAPPLDERPALVAPLAGRQARPGRGGGLRDPLPALPRAADPGRAHQARVARSDPLPPAPGRPRRRALRGPEVPIDVPGRRPAQGRLRRPQRHRRRDHVQDTRGPARDPDRPGAAQVLDRRAPAAAQRAARGDEPRGSAPVDRAGGRGPVGGLARPPARPASGPHRPLADLGALGHHRRGDGPLRLHLCRRLVAGPRRRDPLRHHARRPQRPRRLL